MADDCDHEWEITDCLSDCGDDNCTVVCIGCDEMEAACDE